ncbi:MAG: AMP-binding protein, partial [Deltaproteobacteria bacterium]|nr:AMP-binding protein [Deltaproteobacteria bacterium]
MPTRKCWSHKGTVVQAPNRLSLEEAYPDKPGGLVDILMNAVRRYPDKEAFVCEETRLTYTQALDQIRRVAGGLKEDGLRPDDRVGLLLGNCAEFAVCFFAVALAEGVSVILNTRLESGELAYLINDSTPFQLIVHRDFWQKVEPILEQLKTVRQIFIVDEPRPAGGLKRYEDLLSREPLQNIPQIDENNLGCIMYTSGTTGRPKGAMITHRNIAINSMNCQRVEDFQPEDINLIIVPLFHVTGLFGQLVLSVHGGGTSVIMRNYKTDRALALIEKERTTFTATVPTILWMMINWPDFEKYKLDHFKKIMYGGSPSNEILIKSLYRNFPGTKLCEGFGMTETTVMAT